MLRTLSLQVEADVLEAVAFYNRTEIHIGFNDRMHTTVLVADDVELRLSALVPNAGGAVA